MGQNRSSGQNGLLFNPGQNGQGNPGQNGEGQIGPTRNHII